MEIYEQLWSDAASALERGEPQIDPHLSDQPNDPRRGITILFRPSPAVRDAVIDYLDRLKVICPGQYFYRPEELHVTVLSIISGTVHWRNEIRQLAAYRTLIREVLRRQRPFKLRFRGITATPGSVLIQGFPLDDALAQIRDDLRTAFSRAGFGGVLDRRYKISTAHLTALRFSRPGLDGKRLLPLLLAGRQTHFGEMEAAQLQLVWGDWYASADRVRTLEEYPLSR